MTLNQNLIIICDPHLVGKIWSIRLQHGLTAKTSIISLPLESIIYYQKLKSELNKKKKCHGLQDEWIYICMTWAKINCLKQAMMINSFCSSHFAWIDFGLFYVANMKNLNILNRICDDYPKKIRSLIIFDISNAEMKSRSEYYRLMRLKMAGGFYIGPKEIMNKFVEAFEVEFDNMWKTEYYGLEEMIFGIIYGENRDWFEPYFGDYENIIESYFQFRGRITTLFQNLTHCRHNNLHKISFHICQEIEKSYQLKILTLSGHDLFGLYDEMFIAAYNINRKKAIYAGNKLIELAKNGNPEIKKRMDKRVINNLILVNLKVDLDPLSKLESLSIK